MTTKSTCPDCGVAVGQPHVSDCNIERCSVCGEQRIICDCDRHEPTASVWTGEWPDESEMDQIIRQVALRWHPEWRKRDLWGRLTEEEERHLLTHRLAESLLCHDRVLASIAEEAEENGVDGHEVRHCLARAALSKMWDFHHDQAQFAEQDVVERFKAELRLTAMTAGES